MYKEPFLTAAATMSGFTHPRYPHPRRIDNRFERAELEASSVWKMLEEQIMNVLHGYCILGKMRLRTGTTTRISLMLPTHSLLPLSRTLYILARNKTSTLTAICKMVEIIEPEEVLESNHPCPADSVARGSIDGANNRGKILVPPGPHKRM